MLVLAVALAIARGIYLNSVPQSVLPADAAAALYDTLVRFIRDGLRVLLLVGLVVAAGAFLIGPSAAAVRTRRAVGSGIGWVRARGERAGLRTGPVGTWIGAHKTLLRVAAVGRRGADLRLLGPAVTGRRHLARRAAARGARPHRAARRRRDGRRFACDRPGRVKRLRDLRHTGMS